jgi:flavin reductase (DIM6/NTAB) family NADH-FMN oxidoreductase RutF
LATLLNSKNAQSPSSLATIHIHLLSQKQESLARAFARQPAKPQKATPSNPSPSPVFEPFPKHLFQELEEASLGKLECTVIGSMPLQEPLPASDLVNSSTSSAGQAAGTDATSQLFIAKALSVTVNDYEQEPLLYCHQGYYGLAKK